MTDLSRRTFVRNASLGTLLVGLHPDLGGGVLGAPAKKPVGIDLIENIRLQTSASFAEMKSFYVAKMGLRLARESEREITFVAGKSTVTFVAVDEPESGAPWYHFAFNIPENKLMKALEWQKARSEIIPTPDRARDPDYPIEIRHFPRWNAHSIFFWDPAGNLLEHIARHDLGNARDGKFGTDDLLNISEVAFVVDDQQEMARAMNRELGLGVYPESTGFWWAMGDENGLMLAIPRRIWGENTPDPRRFGVHPTEATIRGASGVSFDYEGFPYSIVMKENGA